MSEDFPAGMGEYPEYSGMTAEELAAPLRQPLGHRRLLDKHRKGNLI